MLIRLHVPGMSAREMQGLVISDIRAEYQHNISQQIYVSDSAWKTVRQVKEDTVSMINSAVNALPENASSVDLSRAVLSHLANLETDNPYDLALNIVKGDMQSLF
jgi:translation initiation factor 2B subunit (eIF-2B alpha/beta/delta family)